MNLSRNCVENIYFYTDSSPYGLRILIRMSEDTCLCFDAARFFYGRVTDLQKQYDWKKIKYEFLENPVYVKEIRQDEGTNYFMHFSDTSILHVYQLIRDLESWEQDFQMVNKNSGKDYREIYTHMNEGWITESVLSLHDYGG